MSVAFVRGEVMCAWKGQVLLVTAADGDVGSAHDLSGLYFQEARFLSGLRLHVNGAKPWLCEAAAPSPQQLEFTYVYPEVSAPGGGGTGQSDDEDHLDEDGIPERALEIRVSFVVRLDALDVVLSVVNRSRRDVSFDLQWRLAADFADIQETQSTRREQQAAVTAHAGDGGVEFRYEHQGLPYRTLIESSWAWRAEDAALSLRTSLQPQQQQRATMRVVPVDDARAADRSDVAARDAALTAWRETFARTSVPGNRAAERVFADNVRDFSSYPLADGPPDEWLALQAGMPAYPAFFGRDALTAGWQAAYVDRGQSLEAALARLARLQSNRFDDWRDEQPGRIPYQVRTGPLARLNLNPYSAYYADYASPLMFVIAVANLYAWVGDRHCIDRYWDAARRILDWARQHGDMDGDGYLEYQTRSPKGTKNQGWKDSGDAIVYPDGSPVPVPIATCELQGYWYIAQQVMSVLAAVMGAAGDASAHARAAADLKARFNRDWWDEPQQSVALALDRDKRRVMADSSNVGHCLACGIIDAERLPAVVGRLFAPELFSGWGIRTLSAAHDYYDPLSYHRGSVWAVEQGTIVFGLRRFGFDARAQELTRALFDLAMLYPQHRIPECVGGFARGERPTPGAYPRANTPQLWNATAFPLAVQSLLGIVPLAPVNALVVDPVLPEWLPEIVVERLRVGTATATIRFSRAANGVSHADVLHVSGGLRIIRQPPPESLHTGATDRLWAALETLRQ